MRVQDFIGPFASFANGLLSRTAVPIPAEQDPLQTDPKLAETAEEQEGETVLLVGADLWQVLASEDGNKRENENAEKFAENPEYYRSQAKCEIDNLRKILEAQGCNVIILDAEREFGQQSGQSEEEHIRAEHDKIYIRDSVKRLSFYFIDAEGKQQKIEGADTLIPLNMKKKDRQHEPKEVAQQLFDLGLINRFIGPTILDGENAGDPDFSMENVSPFDSKKNQRVEGGDTTPCQRLNRYLAGYGDRNTIEGLERLEELTRVPVYKYKLNTDGAHFHIDLAGRVLENSGLLVLDENGFANKEEYNRFIDDNLIEFLPIPEYELIPNFDDNGKVLEDENGIIYTKTPNYNKDGTLKDSVRDALIDRYVIHVSEADAQALATNFIELKNGTLVISDEVSDEFIEELKSKGTGFAENPHAKGNIEPHQIITVPLKTLKMAAGSVNCLTNTEERILFGGKVTKLDDVKRYTPAKGEKRVTVVINSISDQAYSNPVTAIDNAYQHDTGDVSDSTRNVREEWDAQRNTHARAGVINVAMKANPGKPDGIFPNNSAAITYNPETRQLKALLSPMSPGRQDELAPEFIKFLERRCGKENILDLRALQPFVFNPDNEEDLKKADPRKEGMCIEGTGAINFGPDGVLYMGRSYRGNDKLINVVQEFFDCKEAYLFDALDEQGTPIYHTNVMQWVGKHSMGICLESIPEGPEKQKLQQHINQLQQNGTVIVDLTQEQLRAFAGNAIELFDAVTCAPALAIAQSGKEALSDSQLKALETVYPERVLGKDYAVKDGIIGTATNKIGDLGGATRCTILRSSMPESVAEEFVADFYETLGDQAVSPTPFQQTLGSSDNPNNADLYKRMMADAMSQQQH